MPHHVETVLRQTITLRGHTFLPWLIDRSSTVLDLGAHRGEFSREVATRFGCRCIAVEANPTLAAEISAKGIETVWGAIADTVGIAEFHLSDNPEASTLIEKGGEPNGKKIKVPTYTLPTIMRKCGVTHVDLMKVDIEGAEVQLLSSLEEALNSVDQITVEFHDFCGLVSTEQVKAASRRLVALGFEQINLHAKYSDYLFVRRKAIGTLPRLYLKFAIPNARRAANLFDRVARRADRLARN
jgi:FkbM family methyltransferase